jgi:hypothetical protein
MKKKLIVIVTAALVATLGAVNATAQEGVVFIPVDIFACNYKEGKGSADLDAVTATWNAYMDDRDADDYAAWTMTKHYASADQDFDVAWLGAHKNGTSMGEGADDWLANGGEVGAAFGEVLTCDMSGNYASRMFKAPPDGNIPGDGVLVFSNCSLKDSARYEDVVAATNTWVDILSEAGSTAAMYHWYPVFGTGEDDIGWKVITAYSSHTEFGKNYDRMGNGGLYLKSQELFGNLAECDIARVYNVKNVRTANIRD